MFRKLTLDIKSQARQVLPRTCPTSKTTVHKRTAAAAAISTEPTHNSNCMGERNSFFFNLQDQEFVAKAEAVKAENCSKFSSVTMML